MSKELREEIEDVIVDTSLHPVDASLRIVALFERYAEQREREAYRNGYAAGNAKKNYHKKGDASQAVEGLEIRVSALEHRFAAFKETTK